MDLSNLLNKFGLAEKKMFLLALIFLVILYIDFTFIMKLQLRSAATIKSKIIKLKKDINDLSRDLAQMQQASGKETVKTKKIISEEEIPSLLQKISDTANRHNVKIMQMKPSRGTEAKAKIKAKQVAASDEALLLVLSLSCGYHSLGSFLNDLENLETFIAVEELRIVRSPGNNLDQNIDLVLRTYVKK